MRSNLSPRRAGLLAAAALLAAGCGGVGDVSGTVTYQGKPVVTGSVTFYGPDKTPYVAVISIEPSPSGDLMAVMAGNRKDQELDIILLSTKDSKVIRNLTGGFNKDSGYEYIATPGGFRNNAVPWISWAPTGDRIAYTAQGEPRGTQIFVRYMDAEGAVSQITRVEKAPSAIAWSPSTSIAFPTAVRASSGRV